MKRNGLTAVAAVPELPRTKIRTEAEVHYNPTGMTAANPHRINRASSFASASLICLVCVAVAELLCLGSAAGSGRASRSARVHGTWARAGMARLPRVVLWAWERPEDLSFIEPRDVGVAFLAETIYLRENDFQIRPRLQPLRVPEGTKLIAVARIETGGRYSLTAVSNPLPRTFSKELAGQVAAAISRLHEIPGGAAVQIDFDATTSERTIYAEILRELRLRLPRDVPISITALASWCIGDPWIADLPVDQAVPMLFRMGPETLEVRRYLAAGHDYRLAVCRGSAGISTDEITPPIPFGRQIFIFHPRPWTSAAFARAISEVEP